MLPLHNTSGKNNLLSELCLMMWNDLRVLCSLNLKRKENLCMYSVRILLIRETGSRQTANREQHPFPRGPVLDEESMRPDQCFEFLAVLCH